MTEWNSLALADCIEKVPKTTKVQKKEFLATGEFPIVSQEKGLINGYWDKKTDVVKVTDSILVFGDHTQVVKFIDFDFVVGADGVKILKPKKFLYPKYLYYYLLGNPIKGLGYARHFRLLKELSVRFPVLPEQKRIVAILDEAFIGIDVAISNTVMNLSNSSELFSSFLNKLFSENEKAWGRKKFGSVCNFVRGPFGGSLKKSSFVEKGYAVYEQQHAIYDQFSNIRYFIDQSKFDEMSRFELKSGDLIMSCSGTMGKVAIAPSGIAKGIINQALLKLTPTSLVDAKFLKLWMESDAFHEEIAKHSKGVAIKNVASVKVLKEILVPVPDLVEQSNIVKELSDIREQTIELKNNYHQKLSAISELKQSLLQKAFSGELTNKATDTLEDAVA